MNITVEDWIQTGFSLVHRALEMVWWAGAILGQIDNGMAAISALLF